MKIFLILLASLPAFAAPLASGKLTLAKDLTAKAKGIRTLFITIYDSANPSPMPCAAQKVTLTKDAVGEFSDFKLDDASVILMGCSEIPAKMNLKVKLDADGNAGRDASGDIIGMASGVNKGSRGIRVLLDKLVP